MNGNSHLPDQARKFGRGLNSLRVRFTIMIGAFVFLGSASMVTWYQLHAPSLGWKAATIPALTILLLTAIASLITYAMTGKLTRPIENLRSSTLAIARGDYNTAVEVECNCEVGGLADSFKAMVNRLNANVSRIQTLAFEDGVTGLPNRTVLFQALERMEDCGGALFFIDLDNFKAVNDLHGHDVGDQLLREAGLRIQTTGLSMEPAGISECLLRVDQGALPDQACRMLFRFAGDEFVALLGGVTDKAELALLAEQIIASLTVPFQIQGHTISVGCSIGIGVLGEHTHSPAELTKLADLAMYAAKDAGKGRYSFFEEAMLSESIERAQLEADLGRAFEQHEFTLFYQPKIGISSGALTGVEALVRWQHPTRGLMPPGQFIGILQDKRMMEKLGLEVFRLSAAQLRQWSEAGRDMRISVNVCPTQLLEQDFSLQLTRICNEEGVTPRAFTLEITETAAMSDDASVGEQLKALAAAGFSIAIDDFGVGYSNLAKLYQLPFEELKLDKSMIDHIDVDPAARRVVEYTIGMAHGLGHPVIAEGVERCEQLEILAGLGCDSIQGYLMCRPISAEALKAYLDEAKLAA